MSRTSPNEPRQPSQAGTEKKERSWLGDRDRCPRLRRGPQCPDKTMGSGGNREESYDLPHPVNPLDLSEASAGNINRREGSPVFEKTMGASGVPERPHDLPSPVDAKGSAPASASTT